MAQAARASFVTSPSYQTWRSRWRRFCRSQPLPCNARKHWDNNNSAVEGRRSSFTSPAALHRSVLFIANLPRNIGTDYITPVSCGQAVRSSPRKILDRRSTALASYA
ncbi:unnamed protein product [Ixodes pacificus]